MADLDKIKRNVAKMASMNAPVEDIDGYISSEGATVDQVREHKFSSDSAKPGSLSYSLQGAGALPEAIGRGILGFGAQIGGGLYGAGKSILSLENPFVGGAETARKASEAVESIPRIFAPTKDFEEQIVGPLFEKAKDIAGTGLEQLTTGTAPGMPLPFNAAARLAHGLHTPEQQGQRAAAARTLGEVGFDVAMAGQLGKSVGSLPKSMKARMEARTKARDAEVEKVIKEAADKAVKEAVDKDAIPYTPVTEPVSATVEVPGRGVPKGPQAQPEPSYFPRKQTVFPEDRAVSQQAAIDPYARDPFVGPERPLQQSIERTRTGQEMLREDIPRQRELPLEELTLDRPIPQRVSPEQLELPLTRESALAREARETDLAFRQRELEQQPRVSREEAFRKAEEQTSEQARIDETRRKLFEEQARMEEPAMPSQAGTTPRVPRGQRGQFNPEVFVEGFQKAKEVADKGFRLVARAVPGYKNVMLEITAFNKNGDNMGYAYFKKNGEDIYSTTTNTRSEFQRRNVATEVYKFAQELGNDIKPSLTRSDQGKALWEGFEKRGMLSPEGKLASVPFKQRGAFQPNVFTEGLSKLLNVASRKEAKNQKQLAKIKELGWNKDIDLVEASRGEYKPLEAVIKEDLKGVVPDLPDTPISTAVRYWSDANALYRYTQHPIVRWVHGKIESINNRVNLWTDLAKEEFRLEILPGGRQHKIVNPDSVKGRVESATRKQRDEAAEIINEVRLSRTAIDRDTYLNKGYSQQAVDLAVKMQSKYKEILDYVNQVLRTNGKKEISNIDGYLAGWFGEGNYVVRIREKGKPNADSLFFQRAKTIRGRDQIAKEAVNIIKEKGLENVEVVYEFTRDSGRGRDFNISPGVLNDLIGSLERGDPRRQVIRQAWEETQAKNRAGGHGQRRRDVLGGELTGKDLYKSFDRYTDQMAAYVKNVEMSAVWKEIAGNKDMPTNSRIAEWASGYIDVMRGFSDGSKLTRELENFLDLATHQLGGSRKVIKGANKVFLTQVLMVLNPSFGVASLSQSTMFTMPVLQLYKAMNPNIKGSTSKAMGYAYYDMFNMSKDQKAFLEWSGYAGKIDPSFTHNMGKYENKVANWIVDYPLMAAFPKFGERFGRTHSALSAYNLLYENGLRGKELWKESSRLSQEIMGDYSRTGRSALLDKLGIAGEAAGPLTTFYNWYVTTLGVMLDQARKGKVSPLASMVTMGTVFAGLVGAPLIKELELIWEGLKKLGIGGLNEKTPSISQFLIENMPDAAVFGPLDALSTKVDPRGVRLGGSMAAPGVHFPGQGNPWQPTAQTMFPGIVTGAEQLYSIGKLLANLGGVINMTAHEAKQTYKSASPGRMLDAYWDNVDFTVGESGLFGKNKMEAGDFGPGMVEGGKRGAAIGEREDWWDVGASMVGAGTLKEQRERIARGQRYEQREPIQNAQAKVIDLIADRVSSGQGDVGSLVERAISLGIPPNQIWDRVRLAQKNRNLPEELRQIGGGRSQFQRELIESMSRREEARR